MSTPQYDPDDEVTVFDGIGLDDLTVARLMEICESCKAPPAIVIASLVRDVLEDDAMAHDPDEQPGVLRRDSNNDLH